MEITGNFEGLFFFFFNVFSFSNFYIKKKKSLNWLKRKSNQPPANWANSPQAGSAWALCRSAWLQWGQHHPELNCLGCEPESHYSPNGWWPLRTHSAPRGWSRIFKVYNAGGSKFQPSTKPIYQTPQSMANSCSTGAVPLKSPEGQLRQGRPPQLPVHPLPS